MKFKTQWLLRAITPGGESTSLGCARLTDTEKDAIAQAESGNVAIPNGCYAQAVKVFVPVAEAEPAEAKVA